MNTVHLRIRGVEKGHKERKMNYIIEKITNNHHNTFNIIATMIITQDKHTKSLMVPSHKYIPPAHWAGGRKALNDYVYNVVKTDACVFMLSFISALVTVL